MKIYFRSPASLLSTFAIAAGLTACSTSSAPYPSLTPTMANPPAQPTPVWVKEDAVPTTTNPVVPPVAVPTPEIPDSAALDSSVPGAADPWQEIKDYSFERRTDFVARADSSTTQLSGAVSVARTTMPKPGMDDAHATTIRRLDIALTTLDQTRSALSYASVDTWEAAKNDFHSAWRNAQAAYSRVRESGI